MEAELCMEDHMTRTIDNNYDSLMRFKILDIRP